MHIPRSHFTPTLAGVGTTVQDIANAIYRQEGATQNNNPGNLLYAGQPGAVGKDYRGFAIFDTLQSGQSAEVNQIQINVTRGTCATGAPTTTLAEEISCLTPPGQNDTAAYIAAVAAQTGIDPNALLSSVLASGSSDDAADGSSAAGIDLTDPLTLAVIVGTGLTFWLSLRR